MGSLTGILILLLIAVVVVFFALILKLNRLIDKIETSLSPLPEILENLKIGSAKLNTTVETAQETLKNVDELINGLKIFPGVVEELGKSVKDFEEFLKNQVEILSEEVQGISQETKATVSNLRETSEKIKKVAGSIDPLAESINELSNTGKILIDSLNRQIKGLYVEINAILSGVAEFSKTLKKALPMPLSLKNKTRGD